MKAVSMPYIEFPICASDDPQATMTIDDGDTTVQRTVLPSGARVLSQHVPATRSVAIGMWVPIGSRDELPEHGGSTHFLEHLLFKGTARRSALDIAVSFDAVGGESNAETAKEYTQYWARVLDEDLDMAVDVLADMVSSSLLEDDAFEMERGVILDELHMSQDSPIEAGHNAFARAVFGDTPLGRPVGGTPEIIRAVSRDNVWAHYQSTYGPDALIVTAAGNVDHDHVVDLVTAAFDRYGWIGDPSGVARAPRPRRANESLPIAADSGDSITLERDVEQAHLIIGCPSMSSRDDRIPTMSILLGVLGGSMSSRLFQEVREKRGLAYSTYAFDTRYSDTGAFGMYAGTSPDKIGEVERLMLEQLESLAADGPTDEELMRVRGQCRGALALGLEDSDSRMRRLGRSEINGRFITVEGTLSQLEAVEVEDVKALATHLVTSPRSRSLVLPRSRD